MSTRSLSGFTLISVLFSSLLPSLLPASGAGEVAGVLSVNSVPTSDAVVYLVPLSGNAGPPAPMDLTIVQKDKEFKPDWSVVTVGSTVRFENQDDEIHNVRSVSPGNRFDLGAHLPGTVKTIVLKKPGPVMLRCRIHDRMQSFIFVSPTAYFAESGPDGRFRIADVPDGDYRLEAWHSRLTPEEIKAGGKTLHVASGTVSVDLDLRAKAPLGADLTEVVNGDWDNALDQIGEGLEKAVALWKDGKSSSAMLRVMTTHSKYFGESGLSKAISEHLGPAAVEEQDSRFNAIMKRVQKEKPGPDSEKMLRKDIDRLTGLLRKDIGQLPGSP